MRRNPYIAAAAAAILLLCAAQGRAAEPFRWSVASPDVRGTGDSLRVCMTFTFSGELPAREALILSPVVTHGNYSANLRPVVMRGHRLTRTNVSGDPSELSLPAGTDTLRYAFSIPRKEWMDTARVAVIENAWSRKDGIVYRSRHSYGQFLRPQEPPVDLPWNFMEPDRDRSVTRTARFPLELTFDGKSRDVREALGQNADLISSYDSLLRPLFRGNTPRVRRLTLEAWTSPEGRERTNMDITRARLTSLMKILNAKGTFARRSPTLTPRGEDWDSMAAWLTNSDRMGDARLHEILSGEESADTLESRLRREKPVIWEELQQLCFPTLERFVCSVEYVPFEFSKPEDAVRMYGISPAFLSARDFWMVVQSLPEGSDEWCDALLTAAETYPHDEASRVNAVLGLTRMGHLGEAAVWLRDTGGSAEATLARALWLFRSGRYEECRGLFDSLKGKGGVYDMCRTSFLSWWDWKTGNTSWHIARP